MHAAELAEAREAERAKAIKQVVINKQKARNAWRAAVVARVAHEAYRPTSGRRSFRLEGM
jgi:hypothetical protein